MVVLSAVPLKEEALQQIWQPPTSLDQNSLWWSWHHVNICSGPSLECQGISMGFSWHDDVAPMMFCKASSSWRMPFTFEVWTPYQMSVFDGLINWRQFLLLGRWKAVVVLQARQIVMIFDQLVCTRIIVHPYHHLETCSEEPSWDLSCD